MGGISEFHGGRGVREREVRHGKEVGIKNGKQKGNPGEE
jgi:hypothetical protein